VAKPNFGSQFSSLEFGLEWTHVYIGMAKFSWARPKLGHQPNTGQIVLAKPIFGQARPASNHALHGRVRLMVSCVPTYYRSRPLNQFSVCIGRACVCMMCSDVNVWHPYTL
jgi:hypothetical protein